LTVDVEMINFRAGNCIANRKGSRQFPANSVFQNFFTDIKKIREKMRD
jgi:hypothetical protein